MDGEIFGPNFSLPTISGLKSECEEEILLLIKEIDEEYKRKNHQLLEELFNARRLCRAQRDELDRVSRLVPNTQVNQNELLTEKIKQYSVEVEKLKKEIMELKSENSVLYSRAQKISDLENQLESLGRNFTAQQEEIKALQDRLSKREESYQSLKKMVNNLGIQTESNQVESSSAPTATKEVVINQIIEKLMSEEKEFTDNFMSKFDNQIAAVESIFRKELS